MVNIWRESIDIIKYKIGNINVVYFIFCKDLEFFFKVVKIFCDGIERSINVR